MQKFSKFVAITCFATLNPMAFADEVGDCEAAGISISICKSMFGFEIPTPEIGTGLVSEAHPKNVFPSEKNQATNGDVFIESRVYITEHSHVVHVGKLIELDEGNPLDEIVVESARANFSVTLDQLEKNASPTIRENLSPILSEVKEQINSSTRRSLVTQLTTLVDFAMALHQPELAGRVNSILYSVSPSTAKFMQDELGAPRYIGRQLNFNSAIGIAVGPGLEVKEFFGKTGMPHNEGDFRAAELDLTGYSSAMAKLDLLTTGRNPRRISVTSHLSGYRLDQDTYGGEFGGATSQNSSDGFTDTDRIWSGVVTGLKGGAAVGATAASVGTFLGGPPGAAGGAMIGASVGFTGGFMTGYSHPDENYASETSHHTKIIIDVNWANKEIITSKTVTTLDHKTKQSIEETAVKHEKITILPEKERPTEKVDGPRAENNCEGGPCKREVIGCEVPPDMKDSSGTSGHGPLTNDEILERKKEMKDRLNPWILTPDLDKLLGLTELQPIGEKRNLLQNSQDTFTNWGPDGKPVNEGQGNATLMPRVNPLFDPAIANINLKRLDTK